MNTRRMVLAVSLVLMGGSAPAQGPAIPPGDKEPLLRLEAEGPTSFVTALTFSPDGKRLYAAGFDKVVRVWTLNAKTSQFELDRAAYRVPIGPGIDGTINAVALSPDERWLAVGGRGIVRGTADFRRPGLILPKTGAFTEVMWRDRGTIYVFDTQNRTVRLLRGHMGPVFNLAFAPQQDGKPPLLVSAARERDMEKSTYEGVVRVWDVDKGAQVAERRAGLPSHDSRPALAAWHTGKQAKQLRVAIAWEDGKFRVWDAASDQLSEVRDGFNGDKDGMYNNTLAHLADQDQVLTCSRRVARGAARGAAQMQRWNLGAGAPTRPEGGSIDFASEDGDFPRSMTLVSTPGARKLDLAALVMIRVRQEEEYFLDLVDVSQRGFGEVKSRVYLWGGGGKLPVFASAPGGEYLAVAGNRFNSIRIYAIKDLLAKNDKAEPHQILRSIGLTFRFVAFVTQGNDKGLLLSRTPRALQGGKPRNPAEGDVIFNITRRVFTEELADWKIDAPAQEGWNAALTPGRKDEEGKLLPPSVTVRQGNQKPVVVKLQPTEVVTDFAVLPAMPPLNIPILAVAFHELGQPTLQLYNARTGEEIRRFTGHSERIGALAFSADGRLLASVAEDQTICVWSMAKLEKYLGKLGMLPGLAVKNILVVGATDGAAKLQEYDVIEGIVRDDKLHRYFTLPVFYREVAEVAPGKAVTLRIRTPQGKERDISVVVGQRLVEQTRSLLLGFGDTNVLAITNLLNSSGRFSTVPGIVAKYAPVVVVSPHKDLDKDDVIEGLVEGGNVRALPSARDFYEAIALIQPGANAVFRVRGKGNVALVVGQGSDERKPLFSVFVTADRAAARAGQWEWVGWSPIGPYEASDRKAERHVGWHFNTGDPLAPTSFALADQYRKEYYREGILSLLFARGELAAALGDWERREKGKNLPQPKMTLWVDEDNRNPEELIGRDVVVARQLPVKLKLALDNFPPDRVDSLKWQIDDGPLQNFPTGLSVRERTAELALKRGVSKVRVVLRTYETQPQEYTQELTVRYLPPAPAVKLKAQDAQRQEVRNAAFTLKADVLQGNPAQNVEVRLVHKYKDKEVHQRQWSIAKPLDLEEKLNLQPGDNVVEVVAANKDALPDKEGLETERLTWIISYVPPAVKVTPPRLALEQLVTLTGTEEGQAVALEPGKPVIVHEPVVRVRGSIQAKENLAKVEWWRNQARDKAKAVEKFAAQEKLALSERITLDPGVQTLTFSAKSPNSDPAEASMIVDYRPHLPRVLLTAPTQGAVLYDEGKGAPTVKVTGRTEILNAAPADGEILLNDQPVAKLTLNDPEWSASVPLKQAGTNRLQIRVKNAWGMTATTDALQVRYVRPPHNIQFEQAPKPPQKEIKTDKLLIDLSARVDSLLPLIRESVEAEVNDGEIVSVQLVPPLNLQDKSWTVKLNNVPLQANKKNRIRLWVSNPEARSPVPGELTVECVPPAKVPARADVEFVDPIKDVNVTEADLPVRFRVKSESALKRVELIQEGRVPVRETFDLTGLKPNAQGYYEFRKVLALAPRENSLRVVALNDGGEQAASVVVNYLNMPVRLALEKLEPWGQEGKPIVPKVLPDGKLLFPTTPQSRLSLHGKVTWSKENDEQLKKISLVRVYVNGFQQIPAELKPPVGNSRERRFRADLLLNRPVDNQVEIELPDLKQDSSNRREFALACAKPEPGQRLHMLIVGIGEKDDRKLTDQALLALRATKDKGQIKTPAFSQVRIYGPLTDFVSPEQVFTQLRLIKKTIDVLASQGSPNDVVMVYYQGGEAVKAEGNFFETSVSKFDRELRRSGIAFKGLEGVFDETLGAKLLWLDVAQALADEKKEVKDEVAKVSPDTYFSVLRYKWIDASLARKDGGLLSDWKRAMDADKIGVLATVTSQVSSFFKDRSKTLTYDRYVPAGLEKLLVDEKQKP